MANSLNMNLEGKVVILKQSFFRSDLVASDHPFKVSGGFGAMASTNGRMLAGTFISDGEDTAVSGYDVERLASDSEIARFAPAKKPLGGAAYVTDEDGSNPRDLYTGDPLDL